MTTTRIAAALLVALLEAALWAWALGLMPRAVDGVRRRLYPLALAHLLAAVLFLGGGSAQAARLLRGRAPEPFAAFTPSGDPGLARWMAAQRPRLPRPDAADPARLASWAETMRAYLDTTAFRTPPPADPPIAGTPRLLERVRLAGGIERRFVSVPGFDGTAIPGYLFVPPGLARRPAVIVIPGHGEGIVETAGLVDSYQHAVALRLAEAGFVTYTPELRGFGYLGGRIGTDHSAVAQNAQLAGTSYKAVVLRDLRAVSAWMAAQPEVDTARMGVSGVSYGGEMSVALAAMEPRFRAVVAQGFEGGTGPLRPRTATEPMPFHGCHETLLANRDLWQEDLFLLVSPRPMLMVTGSDDLPADPGLTDLLRGVYRAAGRPDGFQSAVREGGHEYFAEPAIAFFRAHL
ncbi:MAG TPA: dienelactone hydrolase family protein [Longimicrobium sp.]